MLILLLKDLLIFYLRSKPDFADKLNSAIVFLEIPIIPTRKPHMNAGDYFAQTTTDCAF